MTLQIGILEGDDIGLEVVPETIKVMKAAAQKCGLSVNWHPVPIGMKAYRHRGAGPLPILPQTLTLTAGSSLKVRELTSSSVRCVCFLPTSACRQRAAGRWGEWLASVKRLAGTFVSMVALRL